MKKILLILALMMALCLPAQAVTIDFNIFAPTTGSISFAGGSASLVGQDIPVFAVKGIDTPLNNTEPDSIQFLSNTFLNFTTGNFSLVGTHDWNFAGGGSITITQGVTPLLDGTFTSAGVDLGNDNFKVVISGFTDTKGGEVILGYYGVGAEGWVGSMNLSFEAVGSPPGPFTSTAVGSGDVYNTPLPATVMLLGTGLLGIVGLGFRRKKR